MVNQFAAGTIVSSCDRQEKRILEDPYNIDIWENILRASKTSNELLEFQAILRRIIVELNSTLDIRKKAEYSESSVKINEENSRSTDKAQIEKSPSSTWRVIPWQQTDVSEGKLHPLKVFDYDCSYLSPFLSNLYGREHWESGWYRWVGPEPVLVLHLPLDTDKQNWRLSVEFHSFYDQEDSNTLTLCVNDKMLPIQWVKATQYESFIGSAVNKDRTLTTICLSIAHSHRPIDQGDQRELAFSIRKISLY